jgi:hypothetical protein
MKTLTETIKTCETSLANHDMTMESRQREMSVWHHLKQYEALKGAIAKGMMRREPTAITWEEAIWRYADGRDVFCSMDGLDYKLMELMGNRALLNQALEDGEWFLEERE